MAKVLIIGGGGAGLVSALSAHEAGAEVIVMTKTLPTRSQTSMAQGGMNAVLGEGDSVASHIADTLKSVLSYRYFFTLGITFTTFLKLILDNPFQT